MKKITIALMCLLSISMQAQYLDNFPNWHENSFDGYPCVREYDYALRLDGDSTIGSITYHIVMDQGYWYYNLAGQSDDPCSGSGYSGGFYGLLREEDNKFYTATEQGVDTLLYDFNLQVGDPLPLTYNNFEDYFEVLSIDSVLIDDDWRIVFNYSEGQIIEGVGSTYGLFHPIHPIVNGGSELICFAENAVTYYNPNNQECSYDFTPNVQETAIDLNAFPNPSDGKFFLTNLPSAPSQIIVQSVDGATSPVKISSVANRMEVDMQDLKNGVYIVQVYFDQEFTWTERIVLYR